MTIQEIAKKLDGMEYRVEGVDVTTAFVMAERNGIVVVFGASDDLMEFRGAISDEIGSYGGQIVNISKDEVISRPDCDCKYAEKWFKEQLKETRSIEAIWCGSDPSASWSYRTEIPHVTFRIMEDNEVYCHGIVFEA